MATSAVTTRRAFLRGGPALMAFAALPAVVAFTPGGPASGLLELIAAHKARVKAKEDASLELGRIERLPNYPAHPKVRVGSEYRRDSRGMWLEQVYATSHDEIDRAIPPRFFTGDYVKTFREDWTAAKHAEFEPLMVAYKAELAAIGALAAEQAYDDACDSEEEARIDLIVFRPTSGEEARTKVRYLSMAEPPAAASFEGRPDLVSRMIEALCEPSELHAA